MQTGIYRHFKGKDYFTYGIINLFGEKLVLYQALYDSEKFGPNAFWLRPKENFEGTKKVKGKPIPRFTLIKKEKRELKLPVEATHSETLEKHLIKKF